MTKSILLFLILSTNLIAQDIIRDSEIKAGLYTNFLAFRKNSPNKPGVLKFIQKGNGRTVGILLENDSLTRADLFKNYWGFSKDGEVYVNVNKFWPQLGLGTEPEAPFNKILDKGYYFILRVETTISASLVGGVAGGLTGALIGLVIDLSAQSISADDSVDDQKGELVVIHHNTGIASLVTRQSIIFLLAEEPELLKRFQSEKKVTKPIMFSYLQELNKLKRAKDNGITFSEKEHWAIITILNKPAKHVVKSIKVEKIGEYQTSLNEYGEYLRDTIPPFTPSRFIIGDKKKLTLTPKQKERFYYQVTIDSNDSVEYKEIDFTRAKYLMDIFKAKSK